MSCSQGIGTLCKNSMVRENENMQVHTPFSPSTNQVKQRTKDAEISAIGKGLGLKNFTMSSSQGMGMIHKNSMVHENDYMQVHTPFCRLTNQVTKQRTKEAETSAIGKETEEFRTSFPPSTNQVKQCTKEVQKNF
ncbi:putative protein isoform X2 [Capsicum annuum]|uniref:uncharacterized protein LOC107845627 isoform X2 n=1 Tax=Capsicum annuum TaxID=4072 RepID=UPI0007BFD9F9|nr:uncharacterized protein LOC107845627 isoform X2 [Capsicum annuum]